MWKLRAKIKQEKYKLMALLLLLLISLCIGGYISNEIMKLRGLG